MARATSQFVCQQCGAAAPKWAGRCESCGAWNTLVEETVEARPKALGGTFGGKGKGRALPFVGLRGERAPAPRLGVGIAEFDRVLGGGLVAGSAILVGGDPGIGKSTLLLQAAARVAASGHDAIYISGEEAIDQIRLRAERLGIAQAPVRLAVATQVGDIAASLTDGTSPEFVVIDSIQTLFVETLESAPGTVAQVRASAHELIRLAKRQGFALVLIGHVTKEGLIAGPRVLEHMVDTVLYFEGERTHRFRILRAVKNRFGPADEIGVFAMGDEGLAEVPNPSALFLAERGPDAQPGASVFAGIEGTRPVLVEIQSLIAPAQPGTPRRAVVGWDSGRLAMVLAVLEARAGISFANQDVYLNVAGGLRVSEPAADLAAAAALVSSLAGTAVPADTVVFGEIGLSGEIRPVAHTEVRLKEAAKLGFKRALAPAPHRAGAQPARIPGIIVRELRHVTELAALFAAKTLPRAVAAKDASHA
ncbi:MAG: DNA repair protein RadA [Rhodospirillales bacterium]|nr:DNA repair protein RadA [Rhodospirillales bacterium]MSP79568.1 DNA repair protein RadA [Rhodospirillales bacterium]